MDILKQYIPLCWFQNHPLQMPRSVLFFRLNLAFYYVIWVIVQANMISQIEAFIEVTAETLLTLLFIGIVLGLNRTLHNYIQVASAILVSENIVAIAGVPIIVWVTVTDSWISYAMLACLIIWDFALVAYIMKKVLTIDIYASLVVAFFYFVGTYGLAYSVTLAL